MRGHAPRGWRSATVPAIDVLFSDQCVTESEITNLKEGFKILKNFAQANIRYQEAKSKAEQAREILDQALKSPE
ncbi:MAG: hypothetical protein ACKO86_20220 [Dolichospermum sp.]